MHSLAAANDTINWISDPPGGGRVLICECVHVSNVADQRLSKNRNRKWHSNGNANALLVDNDTVAKKMKAMPPAIIPWEIMIPITFLLLLFLFHSSHAAAVHVHAARRGSGISERLARSPDSDQIQHWKLAFSDDLAPSGRSRRLPKAVSCRWALNELCLRHVSCRELWTLFRRNCAVDAQNHCRMGNKNDCWQSFEGISWTGLGTCTCAGNNSDCHWIRLQTNYNKCIYELNNDAGWHVQLATAAQFSSRAEERVGEEEEVQRESVAVDTWTEERHHQHQWRAEEWENVRKKEEEENKETKQKAGAVEAGQGVDEQIKKERVEEEKRKMEDKERKRKEKQREGIEETQKKRNEEERRRRIEKEEQRKKRYEEERKRRWREEQRGKEENKAEERRKQVKAVERNGVEEKQMKSMESSEKKRMEEKQTEGRERHQAVTMASRRTTPTANNRAVYQTLGGRNDSQQHQPSIRSQTFKAGQAATAEESSSSTTSGAGGNMHKTKKQKMLAPEDAKKQIQHIITTTVVPPLQRPNFLPTAESQRLVTQAEQPPTTTTASWHWTTTTTTSAPTTTFAPKKSNVLMQHEHPPASVTGTEASSASSISINGSSSSTSSSCPAVLSLCDKDEPCRWHMSELRIKCGERSGACGLQRRRRAQCVQALHRFVQFVHAPLAQALVFCTCANDDANCRNAMFPFLHECLDEENWTQSLSGAIAISQPQWTCTQTMKLCRSESDCRRRLSSLRSACPIASSPHNTSVAQCAASSLSACRAALSATRGSWLDEACACPATAEEGTSCAELAESKWPGHPCVEMVRQDFNEQLRNGQIHLKTPAYPWHSSLPSAPADRHVFVHVGKLGGKGAMALGEEVTVPPSTEHIKETSSWTTKAGNRKPPTSSTTVVPKTALEENNNNNGTSSRPEGQQKTEVNNGDDHLVHIERKLNGVGQKKEVYEWAEDQEAQKLEEDDHDGEDESQKPNNNGTEIGLAKQKTVTKNGTEEWKMFTERLQEEKEQERKTVPERLQMNRNVLKTNGGTLRTAQSNKTGLKVHQIRPHRRQKTTKTTIKPLLDPEALQHFVTQKPPSEGESCTTRNVDGEWIAHYPDSVFRQYDDWAGRCSSWCECKLNGSMQCHQLGCVADVLCEARHTTIGFGQRLYLEDRGACQCHDGRFICDTSELMPELSAGLYITMGYSKAELDLIRQNVPKPVLERSGLISQSTSFAKDLAARLQFALERVLPEQTKCRVVLLEHFAQEEVLLMQLQWFGMEPNTTSSKNNVISSSTSNNKNDNSKPKWHSGKWEKLCAPYVRELEQNFLLERADRYQLLLSTIKQIRVIDLLEGLPQAFSSSSSSRAAPLGGLFVLIRSLSPEGSMLIIVQILFSLLIQLCTFW
uniref:GDNF/GAS1 domain-containing protein n=1 Tax=Globodera rostochiensis TaxID=31243 RepID=A0A914I3C7_GLORO